MFFASRRARSDFNQPHVTSFNSHPFIVAGMVHLTKEELAREERIAKNKALLASLGLDNAQNTILVSKKTQLKVSKAKKAAVPKPKKAINVDTKENEAEDDERPAKAAKVESENGVTLRRSSRNAGKTVDYNADQDRSASSYRIKRTHIEMEGEARDANKRVHNPWVFRFFECCVEN